MMDNSHNVIKSEIVTKTLEYQFTKLLAIHARTLASLKHGFEIKTIKVQVRKDSCDSCQAASGKFTQKKSQLGFYLCPK